ncbi:MAG TPA: IPT/TIG domain-containing protein [Polyangia bacterium]|nr:IPT/TIG domain-containing protein [Polyangia bacterium]
MPPARSATAAVLLGAAAGCGVGAEQPVALSQMMPAAGYSDVPLAATIYGHGFRPSYRFDAVSGNAGVDVSGFGATLTANPPLAQGDGNAGSFDLTGVVWESVGILGAAVPAGIPTGAYDLVVRDPGGVVARLPGAFVSLGLDTIAPLLTIASSAQGGVVGADAPVALVVTADDGLGQLVGLQVTIGTATVSLPMHVCPVSGGSTVSCPFTFAAPTPASNPDTLFIDAQATGGGGLTTTASLALQLVPAPVPTGIAPAVGTTLGGTLVTVSGDDFVSGSTELAFDGQAAGIYQVTPTAILAYTPPHLAGAAVVTVTTGGATATLTDSFLFVTPPSVREIAPTSGPPAGLVPITIVGDSFTPTTEISFGGAPLLCPTFVNSNRLQGLVPPGSGTAAVVAYDPAGDYLPGTNVAFQYDDGTAAGSAGSGAGDAGQPSFPDGGCPGSGGS